MPLDVIFLCIYVYLSCSRFSLTFCIILFEQLIASLILLSGNGSSGALLSTEGPKIFDELTVVQFLQLFRVLKLLKTFKVYDTFEKVSSFS